MESLVLEKEDIVKIRMKRSAATEIKEEDKTNDSKPKKRRN